MGAAVRSFSKMRWLCLLHYFDTVFVRQVARAGTRRTCDFFCSTSGACVFIRLVWSSRSAAAELCAGR